ncbi:Fanconi anemia group B protein [Dissostichus eleginoides]|uniref:Fanconi anemia group B protein n=1 Tax=Dissostichus eleginoides TaxID=100907 RepID=A0AAD9FHB0_DISEL|nr:Fanconi anemia group B protein [Dissostichus eleginoides]
MELLPSEDVYLNPHRLSLFGKIILFNCKRASATHDSERSELIFCSLSFEREDNAFLKAADGAAVISRKRSARVDIVKCKCAINVQKRVAMPCILVTKKSERGGSFHYSLLTLSSSNRLEPCIEFKLPYQMKENVSILQGPTVLWSHAGNVFFASLQAGEVKQIPIELSHTVIGELPLHKEQVFVLGLKKVSDQCSNTQSTGQTLGYFVESGHVFDGSMVLPHPYVCITRCILVLSAEQVDDVLKSTLVAATSNQQLVYFENGIVKDVCQLPFEQAENIQMVNTGRNGCLFVISFYQGHVCAIHKETFQIASHWSSVSSVHVDDFLGCGTDQMLLVFKNQGTTGQPIEKYLLTDLCGISYSRGQDENDLLTLRALESRLQSGLSVLQDLQRELRVKDRVLQQSVQALTDVVSERETILTQPEQEGLIALWDCDESKDEAMADETQDMPAGPSKPQVDKLWHRIAEERMVVGVILTTDSSVPAASVSLSILTEAEPAAKRSKPHNAGRANDLNTCRLAVTAVSRLTPLLTSGFVKCRVVLHYVQRQDAFAPVCNPTPVVLHCGQVALDIHSDFQTRLLKNPELKTDEVEEDLLSLMAVLDRWVFLIDSPDHSLGPSPLMLLHWHQITPFQGELSVHSSQLQTLQFLNSLLAFLPASCSIQPVKEEGRDSLGHEETPEPGSVKGLQRCRDLFQRDVERSRRRLSPLVEVQSYRRLTQSMSEVQLYGDLAALLETQRTLLS